MTEKSQEKCCKNNYFMLQYKRYTNTIKNKFMAKTKSVKKFISSQKAKIRRQFWDVKKQEEAIQEMYNKLKIVKPVK
jgi:hypothetical protein